MANPDFTRKFAESGDKTVISSPDYDGGWDDIVGDQPPTKADFNSISNEQDNKLAYLDLRSRQQWDATIEYLVNEIVLGSDGNFYQSQQTQTNNDPVADYGTNWLLFLTDYAEMKAGRKNLLLNPLQGLEVINQEGFGGGAVGASVYTYDMWKAGLAGVNLSLPDANGFFTLSAGSIIQIIEAPQLAGKEVTISAEVSGAPVLAEVDGTLVTMPAQVTVASTGNIEVEIFTGTFKNVQLEIGGAATDFEPVIKADELLRVMRYFEVLDGSFVGPGPIAGSNSNVYWQFKARKRVTPVITLAGGDVGALLTPTLRS